MKSRKHSLIVSVLMLLFSALGIEPATAQTGDPVLVGAGDISSCSRIEDEATARLLDSIPGTVVTLGDNVYPDGKLTEFNTCYAAGWGRHKSRTRPSAGNHDYHVAGGAGYYSYFGSAASPLDNNCRSNCKGYYSYNLGPWHIIVLNSETDHTTGSAQELWLRADLAANPRKCTLAYWHHPRFSSGHHGNNTTVQPFWQALYEYGADVILNGHDHMYERFAPQSPTGQAAPGRGIRQFVVGTGGAGLYPWTTIQPNSEARNNTASGVLKLSLHGTSYDWNFIPIAGQTYADSGSSTCVDGGPVYIPPKPPVAATLTSPSGNIITPRPVYSWNAALQSAQADAATWYLLRVRASNNSVVLNQWYQTSNICSATTCSVQPATALTGGGYAWEVRAWNNGGYAPWSNSLNFTLPYAPGQASLIDPSGNISSSQPSFSWNISPDGGTTDPATWYYLWVNGPLGNGFIKQWYAAGAVCNGGTCSISSPATFGGGNYTWYIRSWNNTGYGPWSSGRSFSLPIPEPPAATTLGGPSGAIADTTPTYTWNAVLDSVQGDAATHYYLWVNGPSGNVIKLWYTANQAGCSGGGTCSVTPPTSLTNGSYSWWVRTWNNAGYGPWSSRRDFTVGP
jgi:Calcineurin-like phosphoesterase